MPELVSAPSHFFPKLFQPGQIGAMRVKNRIVMPPMGTDFASDTGGVTQRMIDHYVRRAQGGVGLIIVEFTCVDHPGGKGHSAQLALHDDKLLSGHGELVDAVHRAGAKVAIQLHHAGGNTFRYRTENLTPVAPSLIPGRSPEHQPRVLTIPEIEVLVEKFARAAERAKNAGYDAVELHGAHGYLIAEFMSSFTNTRADLYGGSLENRMRFPLAVIKRAKELVGDSFPITFRFSGDEFVADGRTIEESKLVAAILERAGVAALHVTAGTETAIEWIVDPIYHPQGSKAHLAAEIKQVVGIPVITVGVIREPSFAEQLLMEERTDFVAVGRGLLADPDWPRKAADGRTADIRRCISCNYCDLRGGTVGIGIRCALNPEVGRGASAAVPAPSPQAKRVIVVGGGPAGMRAAATAAERGHRVTLFEKSPALGGQLRLADKVPEKDKIDWLKDYLISQLDKAQVEVRLSTEVSARQLRQLAPDMVVLATGAKPKLPNIMGVDLPHVGTAWSVIEGMWRINEKRVAVIGGNAVGSETALYLAQDATNQITVVEMAPELASDMEPFAQAATRKRLEAAPNVQVRLRSPLAEIRPDGIIVTNQAGQPEFIAADAVVLAVGSAPAQELAADLHDERFEVYAVGDCTAPATIPAALYDGWILGCSI